MFIKPLSRDRGLIEDRGLITEHCWHTLKKRYAVRKDLFHKRATFKGAQNRSICTTGI